jgi:hypothetical protein
MGHHSTLLKNDNYTRLLSNAILWAAGQDGQGRPAELKQTK